MSRWPIIILALVLSCAWPAGAASLQGQASVIDGDTIEIHGQRIRLHGIDAPESAQTCEAGEQAYRCGQQAALALADYIGQRTVRCEQRGRHFQRIVVVCSVAGEDVGAWLVANGWALNDARYSRDYIDEEAAARDARLGIWRGAFVPPWDWRAGQRTQTIGAEVADLQSAACCMVCRKGKACGNSCISRSKTCRKPPGCACDAQ
jgi:endonuclease YncB( thermonuclease family)